MANPGDDDAIELARSIERFLQRICDGVWWTVKAGLILSAIWGVSEVLWAVQCALHLN